MDFKNIVVVGGGVLGTQIAFQSAYSGFNVTILATADSIETGVKPKLKRLMKEYQKDINEMALNKENILKWPMGISDYDSFSKEKCMDRLNSTFGRITIEVDQARALKDADLVIESITENLKIKTDFYKSIANLLPDKTIIVTNSSTLLPSKMAKYTKRPEKFLALHFANNIWKNNIAEVMAHSKTDKKYFDSVIVFANNIRMIPLPIYKEKAGYLLNSMLVPFLFSGLDLYVNGISDPESIDKAWILGTGAPKGPFQIIDIIGLETAYNVVKRYLHVPKFLAPYNFKAIAKVLKEKIDEGKLGVSTKEGFYKYDD